MAQIPMSPVQGWRFTDEVETGETRLLTWINVGKDRLYFIRLGSRRRAGPVSRCVRPGSDRSCDPRGERRAGNADAARRDAPEELPGVSRPAADPDVGHECGR